MPFRRIAVPVLSLAALAAVVAIRFNRPPDIETFTDLSYGPHASQRFDLSVPRSDRPVPLIVWIHGGGWELGDKSGTNYIAEQRFRGYAVASVNYRFTGHGPFPAPLDDVRAAVRHLRTNAAKYNLDPDAFGVAGDSAGGHLAALLGTDTAGGTFGRVQCVLDFYGPTDLAALSPPGSPENPVSRLLGGDSGAKRDVVARADPVAHVTRESAPFLIVHGEEDPLVPVAQSARLADALRAVGVPCELVVLPGAGHGGDTFYTTPAIRDKHNEFFDKHLKTK